MIRTGQSRQGSSTSKETIRIRKAVAKATSTLLSKAQVTGKGGRVFESGVGGVRLRGLIECERRVVVSAKRVWKGGWEMAFARKPRAILRVSASARFHSMGWPAGV